MTNKLVISSLLIATAICFSLSATAQETKTDNQVVSVAETTTEQEKSSKIQMPDPRWEKLFREKVAKNPQAYSKRQVQFMYEAALKKQEEYKNRAHVLKILTDNYNYTPEELEKLPSLVHSEDILLNQLDPLKEAEMNVLIESDIAAAVAQITASNKLNPVLLPGNKPKINPLLTATPSNEKTKTVAEQEQEIIELWQTLKNPEKLDNSPKRLGKRSFRIHPDNLEYEKNK